MNIKMSEFIPALPFTNNGTLGKLFNISKAQFSSL